jgi:hypothetical protein
MTSKPEDVSRTQPLKPTGEDQQSVGNPAQGQEFGRYMEKAAGQPLSGQPSALSPFDLAHNQTLLSPAPNFDTLLTQVKSSQGMLGDINQQLNTPNLRLKQSQRYLLRTKLTDANTHLRAANAKMGAELPEPPTPSSGGILGKFLDYVTEGQSNLQAAQNQVAALKDKGDNLKPADFLAIQLKLAHAQQEIEYSSIMLSKVVDDMKTLFNVQL